MSNNNDDVAMWSDILNVIFFSMKFQLNESFISIVSADN